MSHQRGWIKLWPGKAWKQDWHMALADLGACREGVHWMEKYDLLEDAWAACPNGLWMLWLLHVLEDRRHADVLRLLAKDEREIALDIQSEAKAEADAGLASHRDARVTREQFLADQVREIVPKLVNRQAVVKKGNR